MFRLITAQSAAFTGAKKKKMEIFTPRLIPLCSLSLARRACVPCRFPVSFGGAELKVIPRRRETEEEKRGEKSMGEMRSAADLLAFVCACRRRAQEPSQQGPYSTPPLPARVSCFLPLICHPLCSARRQPGGRATGAELITGGSRMDRETDRKDEAA